MQSHVDAALAVECVSRVRPAGVRTGRALEPARIVAIEEGVVPRVVRAELGIVFVGGDARAVRRFASGPTIFAPSSASSSRDAAFSRRYRRYAATRVWSLRKTM